MTACALAWSVGLGAAADGDALPQQVALEGARNFRDLGGYASADGRRVKKGKIFRADNLSALTQQDWQILRSMDVRLVVDFRSRDEATATPPRQPESIRLLPLPISLSGLNIEELRKSILDGDLAAIDLPTSYTDIALRQPGAYRQWLASLLEGQAGASVFHCTSGKDRTGLGAVLLLSALGVPRATALADYDASNRFLRDSTERIVANVKRSPNFRGDERKLRSLLGVQREWMEATLDAIDSHYGSLDNYLETALGLDRAKRRRLQQIYLE